MNIFSIRELIAANLPDNNLGLITEKRLRDSLMAVANFTNNTFGFAEGVAQPSTIPNIKKGQQVWIAKEPGTYTHFGGIVVDVVNGVNLLSYTPTQGWIKVTIPIEPNEVFKFDGTFPWKEVPVLEDRAWGFDSEDINPETANKSFTVEGILRAGGVLNSSIDVRMYGAVGDGVADDREAIQTAVDSANGRWVNIPPGDYRIGNSLNLPEGIKISAYGARVFNTASHIYMVNVNGDTIIKGLELEGAGSTPFDDDGRGINFVGTFGDYKSGLQLEDCHIHDVGFYGIYIQFAKDISITKTKVYDFGYTGIMNLSVENADVFLCHVKGNDYEEGGYGISFTRETIIDTLVANPRSKNCTVENCLVEDILQWKAYDTHGGDNIRFINNRSVNCRQGIGLVSAGNFAPINCKVINNTLVTTRGTLSYTGGAYGVVVAGVVDEDLSTSIDFALNNSVEGNTLIGYGMENNANEGAIRFRNTINTKIQGNIIDKALINAILIQNTNYNFSVVNNIIEDPNTSNAGLNAIGIQVSSQYNTGTIMGNVMYRRNPSLNTKVADRGINVATAIDNKLIIRNNPNNFVLNTNIPLSVDIIQDNYHNATLRINKASAASNQQLLFNEGFSFYADNAGGQNVEDPVAFWLVGRAATTVYVSPRSGGPFKWLGINAETIDISTGKLRLANQATLEPTGSTLDVSGLAESGNVFKNGIHYTTISAGTANNYPENSGMSRVWKSATGRIYEEFSNGVGDLWYRTLSDVADNDWKKVLTDAFLTEVYAQTTDPEVAGSLWNNAGVLTFSNGPI